MRSNTVLKHRQCVRNRRAAFGVLFCLAVSFAHAQEPMTNGGTSASEVMAFRVADQKAVDAFFMSIIPAKSTAQKGAGAVLTNSDDHWELSNEWCVQRLGYPKGKKLEGCSVHSLGGRAAAIIQAVLYCENEHCENEFYFMSGIAGPRRLAGDVYGPWVLSPDRKSLFFGDTGMGVDDKGQVTGSYEAFLMRIDVSTLKRSPANACASPVLSPGKQWIVCRDAEGHVYKMPANGGALLPVYRVELGKDTINIDAHLGVSLHPVRFPDTRSMTIETLTRSDKMKTKTVEWKE